MSGDIDSIAKEESEDEIPVVVSPEIKVVVVGDGAVGKTCLLHVYLHREFPSDYAPTVFDNMSSKVTVDGQEVSLQLWDTAGQEGYERIRTLCYDGTHCFVACFACNDMVSFENLKTIWLKELRKFEPNAKIVLVGTKADLRDQPQADLSGSADPERNKPIPLKKILRLVKEQRLVKYVETSAKRGAEDVDRVFHEAIRAVLAQDQPGENENSLWGRLWCIR
eukprot:maker-scaffold330_size203968-snap-gene-0.21 protein:Tk05061 transcript:maker-scaffold330_size203968-snap-gene-0.21-mRNA-1 annotation:"small gtpase"